MAQEPVFNMAIERRPCTIRSMLAKSSLDVLFALVNAADHQYSS
jgi:hypothetical protein